MLGVCTFQDKRVTSYLALRGEEPQGMLGRVASLGDGVASSLGKLLSPQLRGGPTPRAEAHRSQSSSAARVKHMASLCVRKPVSPSDLQRMLCLGYGSIPAH